MLSNAKTGADSNLSTEIVGNYEMFSMRWTQKDVQNWCN